MSKISIFWFRRDLRLDDNTGLNEALKSGNPVLPIFIFDKNILDELEEKNDQRVIFIRDCLQSIHDELKKHGSTLLCFYDTPEKAFKSLIKKFDIADVFTNTDYEPYATDRDTSIAKLLKSEDIGFHSFKDQVIFEKSEVAKKDGKPYSVFTPYANAWRAMLKKYAFESINIKTNYKAFLKHASSSIPSLKSMGFGDRKTEEIPELDHSVIPHYNKTRDIPGIAGTTRSGLHLRFGTISVRKLTKEAHEKNATYLNELIWREYYMQTLWHHPENVTDACKKGFDKIRWRNNEKEFEAWCEGKTGYPLVDAGMRQLNTTGYMHNRVRMITASFLIKDLLIDWRWGEAYFAKKLLDYELSSNNGNWQWVAGCGCDAAPYFRVFNPTTQIKRFDKKEEYIREYVAEYDTDKYPKPIVDHDEAKNRCLKAYRKALKGHQS